MSGAEFLDTKSRVKEATNIVELVEDYIPLRRKGSAFAGHCPWHDDKSPSLQVDQRRQSWVCWVCNIRGDIFDFVMRKENVEFYEALTILAERARIPIQKSYGGPAKKGSPQDKQTLYDACRWAESIFHQCFCNHPGAELARQYVHDRGITQETISEFQLGFAPPKYDWLVEASRDSEFSPEVLEACGLIVKNNNSYSWYERFRGRLIFPIRDTMNRPIAFGGRLVPGLFNPDEEPPGKYINSPETRLFSKSSTLYGLNLAKNELNRNKELTVVEGYTDVIGCWQAGLRNVVAVLGTALNAQHIKLIRRYADRINLVLDGDAAGVNRTNQILDLFVAENVDLRICTLPDNSDPFDFVAESGKAAFETEIARASDAFEHKLHSETAGIDLLRDTHAANVALENVLSTLARVPHSITSTSASVRLRRDQLLARISRMFAIEANDLRSRLREIRSRQRPQLPVDANEAKIESIDLDQLNHREVELLQLLLIDNSILDEVVENISPQQFNEGPLKELFLEIEGCFHNAGDVTYEALMLQFDDLRLKNLLSQLNDLGQDKQTQTGLEIREQMDRLLEAFEQIKEKDGNRAAISEFQNNQLDDEEEAKKLEQLLQQARQRQGL